MITYADFFSNPIFIILALVLFFGIIVIAVILVKKYSPHFKNEEKPKSDHEIAEEEVRRLLVDVEEDKKDKQEEAHEDDSLDRMLSPVEDEKTAKEIEEYDQKNESNED